MGMKIETRYVDNDDAIARVHVIVNGQDCGPSLPCSREWFDANRSRFELILKEVAYKSLATGEGNVRQAVKTALGIR
jgi:hypothetical protein